jgi:hypothetical protein
MLINLLFILCLRLHVRLYIVNVLDKTFSRACQRGFLGLFRPEKAVYRLEIFEISKPVFTFGPHEPDLS